MTLGAKQRLFTRLIAELITWAYEQGYELTLGDAFRDKRMYGEFGTKQGYSAKNSVHKIRLALDLNLFINGKYQTTTEAHSKIGAKWKTMHELCRWGGNFRSKDGNHYSLTHWGAK